jgi:hypothetical protein
MQLIDYIIVGVYLLDVSSTAAITLISRRVENASNPHDCVRVFPNSAYEVRAALLRTPNSELTLLAIVLFWIFMQGQASAVESYFLGREPNRLL